MADTPVPKLPARFRLPADATPEQAEMAQYGLQRIVDVAAGRVHSKKATSVLKGAVELRKEMCGPIVQRHEVDVKGRLEMMLTESMEKKEPGAQSAPGSDATSG